MSDHTAALLRAIQRCFPGLKFTVDAIRSRDWASATFVAVRHEVGFTIEGECASLAAEMFLAGLDEREFPMPRHILVEIACLSRTDRPGSVGIILEALSIDDV